MVFYGAKEKEIAHREKYLLTLFEKLITGFYNLYKFVCKQQNQRNALSAEMATYAIAFVICKHSKQSEKAANQNH